MSPEVQNAFNLFLAAVLGLFAIGITGIGLLLKASFESRVKQMAADVEQQRKDREQKVEEDRKDRDQKRQLELEEMRQKTATAQASAEQAQAVGENLVNLNLTVIRLIESHSAEQHANRGVLSNQQESMGIVSESVEQMAGKVGENTTATNATGRKVEALTAAVDRLYDRFMNEFPIENTVTTAFSAFKDTVLEAIERHHLTPETSSNGKITSE